MDEQRRDTRRSEDRVVELRLTTLEELVRALGPSVGQVVAIQAGLDSANSAIEGVKDWLRDEREERRDHDKELDGRIDKLGEALRGDLKLLTGRLDGIEADQRSGRRAIIVAVIGATATIIASLVAGYVALKAAGAA